jgi:hypothetical protein
MKVNSNAFTSLTPSAILPSLLHAIKSNTEDGDHCDFNNTGCYRICLYYRYHKTEWLCVMYRLPTFYVLTLGDSHKYYWNIFQTVRREKGSKNEQRFHPKNENIQPNYHGNKKKKNRPLTLYVLADVEDGFFNLICML